MTKGLRLVIVILLLAVAGEVLLPMILSDIVAKGMRGLVGSEQVTATLTKRPALLMLGGNFDNITVNARQAKVDKLVFDDMSITLKDAQLDIGALITRRLVAFQSIGDVEIRGTVTQDELARYLNQTVKGIKNAVVDIQSDKIKASSSFSLGGFANVAVTLEGKIVGDGQKIKFVTDQFLLNNRMTGNLGGALLTEVSLVDLNKLPFHVNVRDIVMENGKVILYLDNRPH
ncbi:MULTISPECIES: DUF2993 domain-containing protein [Pelosinus]|uniref:DUF2993 domain-containing protein n=1 Tax=Pelosinus fermentans B4 TaxID=1149862 RepID=I9LKI8_9FIRM|nr:MULTISPECIES: DUF2993 domain-containing protein [Pelosinus]EIW20951.1 Protein of unknown function DUF2993 [Pelosinus fermentans B4]EIW27181.1 hypothetical protein FA11_1200 [Pelosinus fermentans A11]